MAVAAMAAVAMAAVAMAAVAMALVALVSVIDWSEGRSDQPMDTDQHMEHMISIRVRQDFKCGKCGKRGKRVKRVKRVKRGAELVTPQLSAPPPPPPPSTAPPAAWPDHETPRQETIASSWPPAQTPPPRVPGKAHRWTVSGERREFQSRHDAEAGELRRAV